MSTTSGAATPQAASSTLEFVQYHEPPLKAGSYQLTVTQQLGAGGTPITFPSAVRRFTVAGERFELPSSLIFGVFPPEGSLGEHSNVLPHLMLTRSTLPWERYGQEGRPDAPWLALLVFDPEETPTPQVMTLGELMASSTAKFSSPPLESWQHAEDKVTVIDVPRQLLDAQLPTVDELALLAHVRQPKDASGALAGDERAVVIASRLPAKGKTSTVHLVSVEDRYKDGSFDPQGAAADGLIRLVSLKSWSFSCVDTKQSFKQLLLHLDRSPGTLRLPPTTHPVAEASLSAGYVPLPHLLRNGQRTVSWYRGPFVTGPTDDGGTLESHQAADELLRYDTSSGLFDISRSAAWELGRLLALQSKEISVGIFQWKRSHKQALRQAEQWLAHPHLPRLSPSAEPPDPPKELVSWFDALRRLEGVPFRYLVPDERLLPAESLRFFCVDDTWMDNLVDGAWSVGGQGPQLPESASATAEDSPSRTTGFLLRSDVVAGWPGLLVDAYDAQGQALTSVRIVRLSANVLLGLFEGELTELHVHQQPEALHFGLDTPDDTHAGYFKVLRGPDGTEGALQLDSIPFRDAGRRMLSISQLATAIQTRTGMTSMTSAQFALQMVEGVEKVIFQRTGPSAP